MGHFTIHEANIFWKYYQIWTRDLETMANFVFFCLIKLYKNHFLTHFWYSPVLLLNRTYKTQLFTILCVIKLYKSYFLGYFRYSAVLLLYRTYITQFVRYRKGGLMTVDGCWKIAIFNQNSNLCTSETDKKLKKNVYDL